MDQDSSSPAGNYLLIPCPENQFGEFIAGLLGKPQILRGEFSGIASVTREDINNFFHLIQHRVHEQHQATLVQFTVNTSYDDGTSVEVTSIDEFNSYAEVKPLIPLSISMTWVYLIKFNNKTTPERQQIDVGIRVKHAKSDSLDEEYKYLSPKISPTPRFRYGTALASFSISHTARSWGMDIESLLISHIKNLIIRRGKGFLSFLVDRSSFLGFSTFVFSMAFFLSVGYRILAQQWENRLISYRSIGLNRDSDIHLLSEKIDFIASQLTVQFSLIPVVIGIIYVLFSVVMCAIFSIVVNDMADRLEPSFILLPRRLKNIKI